MPASESGAKPARNLTSGLIFQLGAYLGKLGEVLRREAAFHHRDAKPKFISGEQLVIYKAKESEPLNQLPIVISLLLMTLGK
ncbi:hypothetical protein NDA03_19990 [Trichocoleus sp. Lan]|uniref:hypothetical protein n=1 Tax=Trichocoleus sp. Lan TaxID=2933927 RepID=UPI00329743F9